jgi:hypothetical protein
MTRPEVSPSELDIIILGFARKMRAVALGIVLCAMFLAAPIVWSSDPRSPSPVLLVGARAVEIATWSYLAAILIHFYRRTRLREYLLQYHTYWLSGLIAYPLMFLLGGGLMVVRRAIPSGLYEMALFLASGTWLALMLVGRALRRRRANQMREEADAGTALWWQLRAIRIKDIILLRFPSAP